MTARNENSPGYKKTKVGWIPEEWECVPFGTVTQSSQYGVSLASSEDGTVPIVGMGHLQDGKLVAKGCQHVVMSHEEFEKYRLRKNDLLFNRTNSLDLVGKTALVLEDSECVFASYLVRFVLSKKGKPLYIAYVFTHADAMRRLKSLTTPGVSQFNINPSTLQRHFYIPLPPLPEQERIAEVLGAWDRAIGLTDRLIEVKQRLKKGLMQQLLTGRLRFPKFGKPVRKNGELPKGWKMKPISGVAQVSFSGVDKKRHPDETPVRLCNYMDVYGNDYITPHLDFMQATASVSEIDSFTLRKGDVLITKDSETPDDIGVPAVVTEDLKGVVCGYHLALLRPNPEKADPVFLAKELGSSRSRRHFSTHANGATRFGLSNGVIKKAQIHLPPIEEQKALTAALYACDREIQLLIRKRACLQQQKRGLMQKLLTGEVRMPVKGRKHNVS